MYKSNTTHPHMIVNDHTKRFYDDMWYEDLLHYTGMGKVGDQILRENQIITLYDSSHTGIAIHLFEVLDSAEYTYRGQVDIVNDAGDVKALRSAIPYYRRKDL